MNTYSDPVDVRDSNGRWEVAAPDKDARTWAVAAHLSALLPWGPVGPLIVWLLGRHRDPFVDAQGREALNFQITLLLLTICLCIFAVVTLGIGLLLTIPIGWCMWVADVFLAIYAAIQAGDGVRYRYPLTIRLV